MTNRHPMLDDPRDGPWFDEEIFSTLRDTVNEDVFQRLLGLFLENTGDKLEEILRLDPSQEPESLAVALHALKGSALMVGAREVEVVAEDLRASVRGGRVSEIEGGRNRLREALARVHERVKQEQE